MNFSITQQTSKEKHLLYHLLIALILIGLGPKTCLADGKRILDENRSSVVVVFAFDHKGRQTDQATGFVLGKDGAVVTNYRIVSAASSIKIKTEDTMLEVKGILYTDRENDIAILKIEDKNLTVAKVRDAGPGPEGQKIYLIGSPRGEEKIILEGSLIKVRDIAAGKKLLLITTPVTKGFSGGPVFNEQGEVIGIATFFLEEAQPYYFAMPVFHLKKKLSAGEIVPLNKAKLKVYNKTAEYWYNLGAVYESLALNSSASGAYQEALRIRPDDAMTHNRLGLVYTNLGIYSFAIRELQEAQRLDPKLQEAYLNLGIAYAKAEDTQKAIDTFEKAIALKPDDAAAYNNLAFACFKSSRYQEAVAAARKAISIRPDYSEAYYNLGVSYYRMKMNNDAIEALRQSIRLDPKIPEAHFGLGVIYSMQDMPSAIKEYEILKKLDPAGANALQEIMKSSKAGPPDKPGTSPVPRKEEITKTGTIAAVQPEKAIGAPAEASKPGAPRSPKGDSSGKEPVPSTRIGQADNALKQGPSPKPPQELKRDIYSVQVSYLKNKQGALAMTDRLKKKHYDAFIKIENKSDQSTRYRVLVGQFTEKSGALKMAAVILKNEKMKSIILKY